MICPKCQNLNDDEYIFCVNCGSPIPSAARAAEPYPSVATVIKPKEAQPVPPTTPAFRYPIDIPRDTPGMFTPPTARSSLRVPLIAAGAVLLAGIAIAAGLLIFYDRNAEVKTALPEHLGLFAYDSGAGKLNEIAKREFSNAKDGREAMLKEPVASFGSIPDEFILYADAAEIKIDDMKFVRLDTMTDAGSMRHFDFQASIVNEKPAIKRLKFPEPLANGRYAFALFSGNFDEGRHKFWPLEITASKTAATQSGREFSVALKPKAANTATQPTPVQRPAVEMPIGARVAFCNSADVVVRRAPRLAARKVDGLRRGQKVFILSYSDNYDEWNGIRANWAFIQTEAGKRGWVFSAFLSY